MHNQLRLHFSYNIKVDMMYKEDINLDICLAIAKVLEPMTFDEIERLSRAIIRISNGYFAKSPLKAQIERRSRHGKNHKG